MSQKCFCNNFIDMFFTRHKSAHSFRVYKSSYVKRRKLRRLLSLHTKLFTIASKSKLSVLNLRLFKVHTLLNHFWVIVEHNHVLTRRLLKRLPDALLHGFTWSKVMTFISYEIANHMCVLKFLTAVKISLSNKSLVFPHHCAKLT